MKLDKNMRMKNNNWILPLGISLIVMIGFLGGLYIIGEAYKTSLYIIPSKNINLSFSFNDAFIGVIATLIGIMVTFVIGYQILNSLQIKEDVEKNKKYIDDKHNAQLVVINKMNKDISDSKSMLEEKIEIVKNSVMEYQYYQQGMLSLNEISHRINPNSSFAESFTFLYQLIMLLSSSLNYKDEYLSMKRFFDCSNKSNVIYDACYSIVSNKEKRTPDDITSLKTLLFLYEQHTKRESNVKLRRLYDLIIDILKNDRSDLLPDIYTVFVD